MFSAFADALECRATSRKLGDSFKAASPRQESEHAARLTASAQRVFKSREACGRLCG